MNRILAFRHVPFEGAGRLEPLLESSGIALEYVDLYRDGARAPDPDDAAGLVILGGPMSANDDLPYLRAEMRIIERAIERRQPVLGICLGAQLIAKTLGAAVYRNAVKEIGWYDITLSAEGSRDALFNGLPRRMTVFHWHGETFDLPAGATLLASSEACRNQAFRVGDHAYGLQFHVEITREMIADWCTQDANCGDVRELQAPIDPGLHQEQITNLSNLVLGRWCDLTSSK